MTKETLKQAVGIDSYITFLRSFRANFDAQDLLAEAGFNYIRNDGTIQLRNGAKFAIDELVQNELQSAIIDEIDKIIQLLEQEFKSL